MYSFFSHTLISFLKRHSRFCGHLTFWIAALGFYTLYFGQRQDNYGQSLILVALLFPFTIATTYTILYWLIPRYLLTRRYGYFLLYFGYILVLSLYLELVLVVVLYITVAEYQAMVVSPGIVDLLDVIVGMYLVVFLAVALHLLKRWYSVQAENALLKSARLEAELKFKEAELTVLKAQIHPHFLFNTLNNLYSLTLEKSDLAPDVVLRISDMLDYMLYRINGRQTLLANEVEHLQNYLALERLRYHEYVDIQFDIEAPLHEITIAPLLLLPFVENGFKHGLSQASGRGWIRIKLGLINQTLNFTVENSKPTDAIGETEESTDGIGLINVQKRLKLLYPEAHVLKIEDSGRTYKIELTLDLKKNDASKAKDPVPDR